MSYASVIEEFPPELRMTMLRFAEAFEQKMHAELAVRPQDFDSLRSDVRNLIVGQQAAEQRFDRLENALIELAAAQQRTEARMEELAKAQRRTEDEMQSLAAFMQKIAEDGQETRRQLGGLTMTVGYQLEDRAYQALPVLLSRDFGLTLPSRLKRGYVNDAKGKPIEVNILGKAQRNGDTLTIIGESKAQLSKNDVDRFVRRIVTPLHTEVEKIFPLLVTYMISQPDVEEYAKEQGIALYYSYDF